ncbi:VOC family protein [Oceanobacillus massiliensis]|uniref:VOC family protein n=1 Tax=Oceanobacillus massiliensis TaxID=1465765 RepID=UPI0002895244|nr:VOC family protein [Oceanobacillus massiliensis]
MEFLYERIDHIQLAAPVGSESEARGFYRDILGFKEMEKPDTLKKNGGVWFQEGKVAIHIGIEDPFIPAKKAHPAICVKHIEKMQAHLAAKGIEFEIDWKLPGASRFYMHDPFGNRIEFLEWI